MERPQNPWRKHQDDATIAKFQRKFGAMGFTFQFITLAGFHALNHSMSDLAHGYARQGMSAYVELQEKEFASESRGYTATEHTSAKSAPAISTTSPLRSTRTHPPSPWSDPPKKASSIRNPAQGELLTPLIGRHDGGWHPDRQPPSTDNATISTGKAAVALCGGGGQGEALLLSR